jgi:hypothetical protein
MCFALNARIIVSLFWRTFLFSSLNLFFRLVYVSPFCYSSLPDDTRPPSPTPRSPPSPCPPQIREYRDFLEQQRLMFLNVTDTVVLNQQQREIDQERKEEAIRQKASGRIEKLRDLGAFVLP